MFFKQLKKELIAYLRCVWPFAIAIFATCAFVLFAIKYDTNPYEATGLGIALILFAMAAGAAVIGVIVMCFIIYSYGKRDDNIAPSCLIGAKVLATVIMVFAALLLDIVAILVISRDNTIQFIKSLISDWPYLMELIAFIIIFIPYVILVPILLMTTSESKHKVLHNFIVVFLIVCAIIMFPMVVWEFMLIFHNEATYLKGLWITMISLLTFCALTDVGSFLLICKLLKEKQLDKTENN